jgi:hypothetical protein
VSFSTAICEHLKAKEARLKDPALDERVDAILEGFESARAIGIEPSPRLIHAASELYAELDCQKAKRARLIAGREKMRRRFFQKLKLKVPVTALEL